MERVLGADDYHQVNLVNPDAAAPVGLFMAWYDDQTQGGVHPPEVCLPGSGWEIAWLERTDIAEQVGSDRPFAINRAIIQKGNTRMMVYYWFQQRERRIAWDIAAKFWLMVDGITTGRTDGALVRLTTAIRSDEADAAAEARLQESLKACCPSCPASFPKDESAAPGCHVDEARMKITFVLPLASTNGGNRVVATLCSYPARARS